MPKAYLGWSSDSTLRLRGRFDDGQCQFDYGLSDLHYLIEPSCALED